MAHKPVDKGEDMRRWWVKRDERASHSVIALYHGDELIESVVTPARFTEMHFPTRIARIIESDVALELVEKHLGEDHTVMWEGKAWSVHYTGPLWVTTA